MPSQLVTSVRALLAERADAGLPLSAIERTFILAAITPATPTSGDVLTELESAITEGRRILLADPPTTADPAQVDRVRKVAARRLLAAARSAIDYDPTREFDPTANIPDARLRPTRADVDG